MKRPLEQENYCLTKDIVIGPTLAGTFLIGGEFPAELQDILPVWPLISAEELRNNASWLALVLIPSLGGRTCLFAENRLGEIT